MPLKLFLIKCRPLPIKSSLYGIRLFSALNGWVVVKLMTSLTMEEGHPIAFWLVLKSFHQRICSGTLLENPVFLLLLGV